MTTTERTKNVVKSFCNGTISQLAGLFYTVSLKFLSSCICLPAKQLKWSNGKSVRLGSCTLGFDSESGQTNNYKIGIHSFPAWCLALKKKCGEQAGKFTCCAVGKSTLRDSPILVW